MPIPDSIRVKVDRAYQQIKDLNRITVQFWDTKPCKFAGQIESDGRPTYRIADMKPIDPVIFAMTGTIIQELRRVLDDVVCALWRKIHIGECDIAFPVASSATEYKSEGLGKIQGLGEHAIQAINAIQPYKGGNGDALWSLDQLSNIAQQRDITLCAGNFGTHAEHLYADLFPQLAKSGEWQFRVAHFRAPLEKGDIVFADAIGAQVKEELQLLLFIFINEAGGFRA